MQDEIRSLLVQMKNCINCEKYLSLQKLCINSAVAHTDVLKSVAMDSAENEIIRQDALQVLSWAAPETSEAFFSDIMQDGDLESIRESAKALLYRLYIRKNAATIHPEKMTAYLEILREQYASTLFRKHGTPNQAL